MTLQTIQFIGQLVSFIIKARLDELACLP